MRMLAAVALLSVACTSNPLEQPKPDQCLRSRLFAECMTLLPKGPERIANSNDWSEVVSECETTAYYRSLRRQAEIPKECQIP